MQSTETLHSGSRIRTRTQAWIFRFKAPLLQIRRASEDVFSDEIKRFEKSDELVTAPVIAESKTALWTDTAESEQFLLAGKVQNLRLAVERFNGLEIPAGATFSFWKHLGRASSLKGYFVGRELREGCFVRREKPKSRRKSAQLAESKAFFEVSSGMRRSASVKRLS